MAFHVPEEYRVIRGPLSSSQRDGNNGLFFVRVENMNWSGAQSKVEFRVIASDGLGWEHVSVSLKMRCPKWEEMCYIKQLFWDDSDAVMQLHPPKADYVNNHPFCLHMWRPTEQAIPLPDSFLVGIKSMGEIT